MHVYPHLSALKLGPSYEKNEAKKELTREHRAPRQVLAVGLLLENLGVVMVTVGFVISKLRGVEIPANHNRLAPGWKSCRKQVASTLCSKPPVSGWPGGWGPSHSLQTHGGFLNGTAHGGICSHLIRSTLSIQDLATPILWQMFQEEGPGPSVSPSQLLSNLLPPEVMGTRPLPIQTTVCG